MKKFIITIDTEGDNLWDWVEGKEITTNNIYYLQRFQDLCNKYSFKPVWLSNWEMINNDNFVDFIKRNESNCELGMHLHAWNTPPYYELPKCEKSGAPYLIEYPKEIMEEKIKNITNLFIEKFGYVPQSHRAGRWAIDENYFQLLYKYGYKIDCSITPYINWSNSVGQTPGFKGPDYSDECMKVTKRQGIIEVPVPSAIPKKVIFPKSFSFLYYMKALYYKLVNKRVWLRPDGKNLARMLWLVDEIEKTDQEYIMFMLHSSELMPGGSPNFKNSKEIEKLYQDLEELFSVIAEKYEGIRLKDMGNKDV